MAKEKIEGQFVPMIFAMMDTPAWKATSPRARCIYIELKRRVRRGTNTAFLSYADALRAMKIARRDVRNAFAELEHCGFIVEESRGCLGVNGRGDATVWRLTELGTTSKTSKTAVPDPPTRDYQRWDGELFVPPKREREKRAEFLKTETQFPRGHRAGSHGGTRPSSHRGTRPVPTGAPRRASNGSALGSHGGTTTSLATPSEDSDLRDTD